MAVQNVITAMLRLATTGVKETVDQTGQINTNLRNATAQAERLNRATRAPVSATMAPGGTNGSRQAAGSPAAQPPGMPLSNEDYGRMRGAAGGTGASARDFANQAQGLGGIVRLYATYAANVFAVGAAYRALSAAQDTTNMVKGLDQLGAASGVALGTLSKRLVEATDGAISLREAMEATTKAVSSGMSSENVLRMGKVAKQAAQALGVDMADAVSRISRGITKLEPELLDEIGIFTRIDPAVQAYAKSVGKAASSLTDFERRMAFANAVLEEGEKKFGEIDIDTNPYTKLIATLKDLTQTGLELINKFIVPFISYMAQSPTALGVAIAGLAAILVKQALPAIGQFKESFAVSAAEALEVSQRKAADAVGALQKLREKDIIDLEDKLEDQLRLVTKAEEELAKARTSPIRKNTSLARITDVNTPLESISAKDLANADRQAEKLRKAAANASTEVATALKAEADAVTKLTTEIRNAQAIRAKEIELTNSQITTTEAMTRGYSNLSLTIRASMAAQEAATKKAIISNAAYDASLIGPVGAFRLMKERIKEADLQLGLFGKTALYTRGALAMLAGGISTVMNALGGAMQVIGLLVAAFSMLDGFLSKADKATGEFNGALKRTEEAGTLANNTLNRLFKDNIFSQQALKAQANSMMEFASAIENLAESAAKAKQAVAGSWWDSLKDNIASIFGGGISNNFEKTFAEQISSAVSAFSKGPIKTKLSKELEGILNISNITNFEELRKAVAGLGPESEKVKRVNAALKEAGITAGIAASKVEEFSSILATSGDSFKALAKTFEFSTPLTKYASDSVNALLKLSDVMKGPVEESLDSIVKAFEVAGKNPIFGLEASRYVSQYAEKVRAVSEQFNNQAKETEKAKKALEDLRAKENEYEETIGASGEKVRTRVGDDPQYQKRIQEAELAVKRSEEASEGLKADISKYVAILREATTKGLSENIGNISKVVGAELAKGSTELLQKLYAASNIIPELAAKQFELKNRELDSEAALITQLKLNAQAVQLNTISNFVKTAEEKAKETTDAFGNDFRPTRENGARAEAMNVANKELEEAKKLKQILLLAFRDPQAALQQLSEMAKGGSEATKFFAGTIKDAALETVGFLKNLRKISDEKFWNTNVEIPKAEVSAAVSEASRSVKLDKDELSTSKQILENNIAIGKLTEDEAITQKDLLNNKSIEIDLREKLLNITKNYADQLILADAFEKKAAATADKNQKAQLLKDAASVRAAAVIQETAERTAAVSAANAQKEKSTIDTQTALTKLANDRYNKLLDSQEVSQKIRDLQNETNFAQQEAQIAEATRLGFSQEYLLNAQAELDLVRLRAEETSQLEMLRINYARDLSATALIANEQEREAKMKLIADEYVAQVASIQALSQLKQTGVSAKLEFDLQENAFSIFIDQVSSIGTLFEEMGWKGASAFGEIASELVNLTKTQDKYAAQISKAQAEVDFEKDWAEAIGKKEEGTEALTKAEANLTKTKDKQFKDELTGTAKIAGSAKKLFKEKTAAHKALAAVEKVLHITRLAMDVKEMISDGAKTVSSIANSTARTGASIAEAGVDAVAGVVKAIASMPFPLNIIAGVATAAVMAGLMSQIGGKKPSAGGGGGFVPNAEQRQETQGTAMDWDSTGNKVQVRRGVFGDTDAKSESIANSLEIIKDNSVDGLSYDNKMLKHLESIDAGINNAAKGIYGIRGLRTGSLFGTIEGTQSGKGLLGSGIFGSKTSTNITDSGVLIQGAFSELAKVTNTAVLEFFEDVTVTKKSWYGKKKSWNDRKTQEIDEDISAFFQDIFGNATDLFVEIGERAGISLQEVNNILANLQVDETLSTRDLKGEDLEKEVSAVIGAILDDATVALFGSFEKYADFGEGMLETVIRVVDNNEKVQQQIKNIGIKSIEETLSITGVQTPGGGWLGGLFGKTKTSFDPKKIKEESFKITEALISLAGGIEEFLTQSEFYRDNFMTQGQRLVPIQAAVVEEMERLGLSSVTTRKEFNEVVSSLDITTVAGRETYQSLMNVAEGFDTVASAAEDRTSNILNTFGSESNKLASESKKVVEVFQELNMQAPTTRAEMFDLLTTLATESPEAADALLEVGDSIDYLYSSAEKVSEKLTSLQRRILELTQGKDALTSFDRAEVLKDLDPSLVAAQEYVWALEDLSDAEKDLAKARETQAKEIESAVKSTKQFIDNIKKLRESLLLDSTLSTLTPAEQYATAKDRAISVYNTAMSTGTSEEEVAAREKARGELSGAVTDFLKISRELYASSELYTNDFNAVQAILNTTEGVLGVQLTTEEQTLETLKDQLESLGTINSSVMSVETAISNLTTAQNNVNTALTKYLGSTVQSNVGSATNSILPDDGSDTSVISSGGAFISADILYGKSKDQVISLADANTFIAEYLTAITEGNATKESLYNLIKYDWGVDSKLLSNVINVPASAINEYFAEAGLPAFAVGTNYVPEDMFAQIHKGERIIPAADNTQLMAAVDRNNNDELVQELKQLNAKIAQLEITIQQGDIMNAQATERNTTVVSSSIKSDKETQLAHVKRRITQT